MTDEDRPLLIALTNTHDGLVLRMKKDDLTQADHIEIAIMFLDMADRVLKRMMANPGAIEDEANHP